MSVLLRLYQKDLDPVRQSMGALTAREADVAACMSGDELEPVNQ
jgi:hypothetical protein